MYVELDGGGGGRLLLLLLLIVEILPARDRLDPGGYGCVGGLSDGVMGEEGVVFEPASEEEEEEEIEWIRLRPGVCCCC